MQKKIVVTGIKPTGMPHLGNYLGMIRQSLQLAQDAQYQAIYFVADYHALTSAPKAEVMVQNTYEVAATWLALGLDPDKVIFYKQSDVPEIMELAWILSCVTKKGSMNMAHAYKAATAQNIENEASDADIGINMGLYNYPILMAADVLLFQAHLVPVGKDQLQHIEIMRDIAGRFNAQYKSLQLRLPQALTVANTATVPGLDGRKMSKSYGNTIPLFAVEKTLQKLIGQIKTDSSLPGEPKDPDSSLIFQLYREFASAQQTAAMKEQYIQGISWKEAKQALFDVVNTTLCDRRVQYQQLMSNLKHIDDILVCGASKARAIGQNVLQQVRQAIGIGIKKN